MITPVLGNQGQVFLFFKKDCLNGGHLAARERRPTTIQIMNRELLTMKKNRKSLAAVEREERAGNDKKEQGYQKKDFGMITGCDEAENGYLNLTLE